jgi:hypothetical protein
LFLTLAAGAEGRWPSPVMRRVQKGSSVCGVVLRLNRLMRSSKKVF